jgi:hypothetical protein
MNTTAASLSARDTSSASNTPYLRCTRPVSSPWGCIVLDPRPIDGESTHGVLRKDLFENIDKRTIFFVASMTDPSVTRHLIEKGATIIGFHAYSNAIQRVAAEEDFPLDPDTVYITGGTCAATRAVGLLHTLGFRQATMIGLDGSFPEPPDEEKNDKITSPRRQGT